MTAAQGTCAYCGREMWLAGLERCCDDAGHAGRLVCADIRGCVDVVLGRLHERVAAQVSGPYETERDAMRGSLWHQAGREGSITAANLAALLGVLDGIDLAACDRRIIEWLAGYEPSTVAVVVGLISRARAAGGAW